MSDTPEVLRARIVADIKQLMDKTGAQFVAMEIPGAPGMVFMCGAYPRSLVDMVNSVLADTFPVVAHGRSH